MTAAARHRVGTRPAVRVLLGAWLVASITGAATSPAIAGGWWTTPRLEDGTSLLVVGRTTTVSALVMLPSVAAADAIRSADHPYYAHLVRGIDEAALTEAMTRPTPGDWWQEPSQATRLAQLAVHDQDANLLDVTATFTVPAVDPGVYDLMLCDLDCSTPLADVIPMRGIYVADPAAVEILANDGTFEVILDELERLRTGVEVLETDVGDAIGTLDGRLDEVTASIAATDATMLALRQQVDATPEPSGAWLAWTGWAIAGAVLAFARSGPHPRPRGTDPETTERPALGWADELDAPPEFVTSP